MLLHELYDLAMREHLVPDPDYEIRPIPWLVTVGRGGTLIGISTTRTPVSSGKKLAKSFSVPRSGTRTSGDRAFFFYDKAEYFFGVLVPGDDGKRTAEKVAARHRLFVDGVRACADATHDEGALAAVRFFELLDAGEVSFDFGEVGSTDLFAISYEPDDGLLITERPAVRAYWKKLRAPTDSGASSQKRYQCLVTGELFDASGVDLFPMIKKLAGGGTTGCSLVGFNSKGFESYGWERNENAPIKREVAEAAATALNRLVDNAPHDPNDPNIVLPKQNIKLSSNTTVCYWNRGESSFSADLDSLMSGDEDRVRALFSGIHSGAVESGDMEMFYAMTLTGTTGRVIVRDWFEDTIASAKKNICAYFNDIEFVRSNSSKDRAPAVPFAMRELLEAVAEPGRSRADNIPPALAAALVNAALTGRRFPENAMTAAIRRYRNEISKSSDDKEGWATRERNDARAAVIKAVINRKIRKDTSFGAKNAEVKVYMDPNNKQPGYLLGRLIAVLEKLQSESASGDINATLIDRYFQGASATPKAVFPRLLTNARNHVKKLREKNYGSMRIYENIIDDIVSCFDVSPIGAKNYSQFIINSFPAFLPLEEQGYFVIGYHQMRHWLWMNGDEQDKWEDEHADAPRAYKRRRRTQADAEERSENE